MWVEWDVVEERVLEVRKVEVGRCVEDLVMEVEVVGVAEEEDIIEDEVVMKEEVEGVDVEEIEEEVSSVDIEETEEEEGVVSVKVEVEEVVNIKDEDVEGR